MRWIAKHFVPFCLIVSCLCAFAQEQGDGIASGFRRISPEEETRLRAFLAERVPDRLNGEQLAEHFRQKKDAAMRLGDEGAQESIIRQWMRALPNTSNPKKNLAAILRQQQKYDEAIGLRREAIELATTMPDKALSRVDLAQDFLAAWRNAEAQQELNEARLFIDKLQASTNWSLFDQIYIRRARYSWDIAQSELHQRFGRWGPAVISASDAVANSRQILRLIESLPRTPLRARELLYVAGNLHGALSRNTQTLRAAGELGKAEESLKAEIRLSRELELQPINLSYIYSNVASLRFDQREFVQSETNVRKAIRVTEALGHEPLYSRRVWWAQKLIAALEGQQRWADAKAEFDRLDSLAADDTVL